MQKALRTSPQGEYKNPLEKRTNRLKALQLTNAGKATLWNTWQNEASLNRSTHRLAKQPIHLVTSKLPATSDCQIQNSMETWTLFSVPRKHGATSFGFINFASTTKETACLRAPYQENAIHVGSAWCLTSLIKVGSATPLKHTAPSAVGSHVISAAALPQVWTRNTWSCWKETKIGLLYI